MSGGEIERLEAPNRQPGQRPAAPERAIEDSAMGLPSGASLSSPDRVSPGQLLGLQRAAGNKSVLEMLSGNGAGIQRAPGDDPRRTSGMAHGPTIDSAGGVATGPTLPGGDGSAVPAPAPAPGAGGGVVGSAGAPLSGPRTVQSQEDEGDFPDPSPARRGKHPEGIKPAVAATRSEAEEAYRKNPQSVYRSKNESLHGQYWRIDPATGGGAPRIYKSGNTYIIAPDLVGPGLPPPHAEPIEADEGAEAENVRAMGEHLDARRQAVAASPAPTPAPDDAGSRAMFPGSRRGPEPGMKPAEPVSHEEVMKAYRENPNSVYPSKDDDWHRQVYGIDRGQGAVPRAYRSGSKIIVDPSYPLDGTEPGTARTAPAPGSTPGSDLASVVNPVQIPSDPAKRAEILRDPVRGPQLRDAINAQNDREREEHMARARAGGAAKQEESKGEQPIPKAMSTIAPAPINAELESGIPNKQTVRHDDNSPEIEIDVPEEKKPAKWGASGGNITRESTTESQKITRNTTETKQQTSTFKLGPKGVGNEWKQRDETKTDDKVVAKENTQGFVVGPTGVTYNIGKGTEEGKGETAGPDAPKTKTNVNASFTAGPGGVGGTGTASVTSQTGAKAEATGGFKFDDKGVSGELSGGYTGAKGVGVKVTAYGGISVEASDPVLVDGEYEVTYTVTETSGAGVGGSYSKPGGGGPAVGVNVGSSTANAEFETRRFKNETEAKVFKQTAAMQVAGQRQSAKKPTTAEGALDMKVGESRGSSETDTDTKGVSGSMEGAELGFSKTDSVTRGLKIKKVSDTKVQVTPSRSETEGKDASVGAWGAFGNTSGSSETDASAVTYEFDLGSPAGKQAFEMYCRLRIPPSPAVARWVRADTGHSGEDHDVYKFSGIGTIGYQDSAFQQKVVDEQGTHDRAGGGQSHKVDLNWVRHVTRDENVHSETQIVANLENGKEAGVAGQMTVGGESGEYNREQFGQIFSGAKAKPGTDVTTSGEWTLSADIDEEAFRQTDQVNSEMRKAKTKEEKIKIYGELAKKNGATMLSGQVRSGGKALAWNLELKGDPNFPGAAGRAHLQELKAKLADQLKSKPASAGSVASEAKDTLDGLEKRLAAVSDEKKYTDLPDELRKEQTDLIKDEIAQFRSLRSQALSLSMRGDETESIDSVRARASKPHGYDDVKPDQREITKLRDSVEVKEADIAKISGQVQGAFKILNRMMNDKSVRIYNDGETHVKPKVASEHSVNAIAARRQAHDMDERLKASAQKARELRAQWANGKDPQEYLTALRALDAELKNQYTILELELEHVHEATREAYIITTDEAIGRDWSYFQSIKADGAARSIAISGFDEED